MKQEPQILLSSIVLVWSECRNVYRLLLRVILNELELTIRMCILFLAPYLCRTCSGHMFFFSVWKHVYHYKLLVQKHLNALCAVSVYGTKGNVDWWNASCVLKVSNSSSGDRINSTFVTFCWQNGKFALVFIWDSQLFSFHQVLFHINMLTFHYIFL